MNRSAKLRGALRVCLLLAAAACGGGPNSGGTTTTTAPVNSAPANPLTAGADPRAELTKAMGAQLSAKSYRAQMVSASSNGTNSTMVVEFVAPDRFRLTQDMALPGRGNVKRETIIIGKDTWMKAGAAPWQKFPVDIGSIAAQFRDPKVLDELAKSAEIKYVGPDTIDGAPALVYEYTLNDMLGKGSKSTAKTWLGAADSLPRKTESEGEFAFMGKPLKTKTTVTYSDYNADIKIAPPM